MSRQPASVLFACTLNSIRSPMAEAILKHLDGRRIYVDSVGVRTEPIDPFAIEVMNEIGIDMRRHDTKTFDELHDTSFDLIVALSPEARQRAEEITRVMACDLEFWPIADPTLAEGSRDTRLAAYREIRDQLLRRIRDRFPATAEKS
jgi:protein-tyrosine-phosphatase